MIRIIGRSLPAGAERSVFAVVKILTMCIISGAAFDTAVRHHETATTKADETLTARQQLIIQGVHGAGWINGQGDTSPSRGTET